MGPFFEQHMTILGQAMRTKVGDILNEIKVEQERKIQAIRETIQYERLNQSKATTAAAEIVTQEVTSSGSSRTRARTRSYRKPNRSSST